jgi:hypothetical protein
MDNRVGTWELTILDGNPPTKGLGCLTVGKLTEDGDVYIITGGKSALLWYRPDKFQRGIIAEVDPHVGVVMEDVDGDGVNEVIAGHRIETGSTKEDWMISWFDPGADRSKPWTQHVIDPATTGGPHDLLFFDVDRDGETELIANAMYCKVPGLFIYKRRSDFTQPWEKYTVQTGFSGEGTVAADLDGDGKVEIISGPYIYSCPDAGPLSGLWKRDEFAAGFREMCRAALVDITGNGKLDVIIAESEYPDGRMSWFENRTMEDPDNPWTEHPMDLTLNFAHSMQVWQDPDGGAHIFLAEMAQGGWNPPYNWDARLFHFATIDNGDTWHGEVIRQGTGSHEATAYDIDGDGEIEFIGKECYRPRVQIWKRREEPSSLIRFRHRFLDREKPYTATDILAMDVDGDDFQDVVCGAWWYKNPTWERYQIPGIYQVHTAYDIDGDGREELIATKRKSDASGWYDGLSSELCWVKPVDPANGEWEEYAIGTGHGDWIHGAVVAPVLPDGKLALVTGYHSAGRGDVPEIFVIPDDPKQASWDKRILAEIPYGEEFVTYDLDGDGKLDVIAGEHWLENLGDGTFKPHKLADVSGVARVKVADINEDGKPDIVFVVEDVDYKIKEASFVSIGWLENPGDPRNLPWKVHVIENVRSPHSLDVFDLDGDGELEVIVGEHDPFKPYRSRSRLLVYKKAEPQGRAWAQYALDGRFEHHDGTKVFQVAPDRLGIISHGWAESKYVHLWEAY